MSEEAVRVNHVEFAVREVVWTLPWASCDRCHQPARDVWNAERLAIDIDLDHPVLLLVRVSVHHCLSCNHYFRAQPPFLRPDASYTNRVVNKAVQSVYVDGMAVLRVANRLARDFWVKPSEAMIRVWCHQHSQGLSLDEGYQPWVLKEFSGVLCVDEVYQNDLALLLAVDPASEGGDRLVGYQLVHGKVAVEQIEDFLTSLHRAGIEPEEVITDGSALYPTVFGRVWAQAAHQLCLFHETRAVTKAVLHVAKEVRTDLPQTPVIRLHSGRLPLKQREAAAEGESASYDRDAQVAEVRTLRRQGHSMRSIVRQTGHSRNTVRRWLEEEQLAEQPIGAEPEQGEQANAPARKERTAPKGPPPPWKSWDEIRQFSQALLSDRFLLVKRAEHRTEEDDEKLMKLLSYPGSDKLVLAKGFMDDWYRLWRDEEGQRREREDAFARYRAWRSDEGYRALAPLKRVQMKIDEERFGKLSHFLEHPGWEGTNNGAERWGREFRHLQGPHFDLRTEASIDGAIKAKALIGKSRLAIGGTAPLGRSNRGRKPQYRTEAGRRRALLAA